MIIAIPARNRGRLLKLGLAVDVSRPAGVADARFPDGAKHETACSLDHVKRGSVGDSYGNALAETINGPYKTEVIRRRSPRKSRRAIEFATLEWVDRFNHRRLFGPIGTIPAAEAERHLLAGVDRMKTAA